MRRLVLALALLAAPSLTSAQTGTLTAVTVGGGGGASDHGDLTGLADDDHLQYHTDARAATWLELQSIAWSAITGVPAYQPADADLDDLADGSLTGSKVEIDPVGYEVLTATDLQAAVDEIENLLLNSRSTGIRYGGGLTDLGAGVVRIAAGVGGILDNSTPATPTYDAVQWSQTDLDLSAVDGLYYIYVSSAGTVTSGTVEPSHADYRDAIWLHRVSVRSGVVSGVTAIPVPLQQYGPQIWDLFRAIGAIKSGLVIAPASTDLTVAVGPGEVYVPGANFFIDPTNPHELEFSAVSPVTFRLVDQDGDQSADTTVLDVGSYDESGTVTPVPGSGSRAQIFTWKFFPGGPNHRIFYGQEWYASVSEARQALEENAYIPTLPSAYENAITLGWIIAEKSATDLADGTQQFVTSGKFGLLGGGASSSGANALLAANNLSDLTDAATARTNLGVAIGSDVQAWDADLDALATYARSGADTTLVTGTAGGSGICAEWNADGDLVAAASAAACGAGGGTATGIDYDDDGTQEIVSNGASLIFAPLDDGTESVRMDAQGIYSVQSTIRRGWLRSFAASDTVPNLIPERGDSNTGIGWAAADDLCMIAGSSCTLLVSATTAEIDGAQVNLPAGRTCASSGDANPGTLIATTSGGTYLPITNSDPDGCSVTLSETATQEGQRLELIVVSTAGGNVSLADTSTVQETGAGCDMAIYGAATLRRISDRWVLTSCRTTN